MKELQLYECEICKTRYAEEKRAIECEKSHRIIKSVEAIKYRSFKSNPKGYPDRIKVTFDDGFQIEYKR